METSGKYDEPWSIWQNTLTEEFQVRRSNGDTVATFANHDGQLGDAPVNGAENTRRAVNSVNALDGCPDPKGFISAVRYVAAGHWAIWQALKKFADSGGEADPLRTLQEIKQVLVTHDVDPRLTWLPWREPKKKTEEKK